jgi:hypothetical protein
VIDALNLHIFDREKMMRARLWKRPDAAFVDRMNYDVLVRNEYAYGMYQAALQAKALGITEVSAIEFGVFNGEGLRAMEKIGTCIGSEIGVSFTLFGFDTGAGMPKAVDHRDAGYIWDRGLFAPQRDLSEFLNRAELFIGDVAQTVPRFCAERGKTMPPLAFVSVDVDFYSASVPCLTVFDLDHRALLPRPFVYLDDTIGDDQELHSRFTGELAAIDDFNARHEKRKIAQINGLRWKRKFPAPWNDQMYVAHIFDHPRYNEFINRSWKSPGSPAGT